MISSLEVVEVGDEGFLAARKQALAGDDVEAFKPSKGRVSIPEFPFEYSSEHEVASTEASRVAGLELEALVADRGEIQQDGEDRAGMAPASEQENLVVSPESRAWVMLVDVKVVPTLLEAEVEMGPVAAKEDSVVMLESEVWMRSVEVIEVSSPPSETEVVMSGLGGSKSPASKDLGRVLEQVPFASLDEYTIFISFPSLDEG